MNVSYEELNMLSEATEVRADDRVARACETGVAQPDHQTPSCQIQRREGESSGLLSSMNRFLEIAEMAAERA